MSVLAKVKGDTLIKFPYTLGSMMEENPYTDFGADPDVVTLYPNTDDALMYGYTLVGVVYDPPAQFDPTIEAVEYAKAPTLIDGQWRVASVVRPLTEDELNSRKEYARSRAASLLSDTDWAEVPSVSNTAYIPHLINFAEFMAYRLALRAIAVTPTSNPQWPTKPEENWQTV